MISNAFFDALSEKDVEYKMNFPMAKCAASHIGAEAAVLVLPNTEEKLLESVKNANKYKIPYKIIGRMSNILPCDERFEGALISTRHLSSFRICDSVLEIQCGAFMPFVIRKAAKSNLGGMEALSGIPGTLGGMIYSNAGAFSSEISDFLIDAKVFSLRDFSVFTVSESDLELRYRKSALRERGWILLSARLSLFKRDSAAIVAEINAYKEKRLSTQPYEYPSLGSVFKRTPSIPAALLIDKCGFKGYRIGGAMVSDKHAGFIVNLGNAKAEDFKALISLIKSRVLREHGILLSEEIEFLENYSV